YMGEDGKPAAPGLIPTLEQSMEQRMYLVGTAEDVAEGITFYRELLGCDYMILFPQFAGDPFALAEEQLERFMSEVVPLLG
ncbi:MAG: LLM class flavin-dependent oxidoreductase, partial [Acidimicrobiia bacterium]|nr:LLM class flavin-dependent oxidoreductase [Acidimicrobiia bacterium]